MNAYVLTILAFFATLVGIFGDTHKKEAKGLKRLTILGYCALVIAIFACLLTVQNTAREQAVKEQRTEYAVNELKLALRNITIIVYAGQNNKGSEEGNEVALFRYGKQLEEILAYYQDVMPNEIQFEVRYIRTEITEGESWGKPFEDRLQDIKEHIGYLAKLMKDDSFTKTGMENK